VVPEASISADFALAMVPHTLSVTAWALPSTVASGARTSLSASATDSQGHSIACSWSDGGAGGSFSPSAAAQNPSYIAPVNVSVNDRTVTLTVIAACNGPTPLTNSGSTTLTVQAVPPSSLAATAVSVSQINLAWRDNSADETGFKIERKTGATGTYAQIATVGANVVTYQNTGLAASTSYYYRVRAYNATGNSPYSNEAHATTPAVSAPSTLTATAPLTTQINLAWRDNASNETGFKIERKTGSTGTYAQIATVGANVVTYTNSGRTANTKYYYRVRAYTATANSAYSNEVSATTPIVSPPTTLVATALSTTQIKLTWRDNATNETGFKIERKTGSTGTWAQIATPGANVVTYTNSGRTANTKYYYRVRAYNASGNSPYSNEANATTFIVNPPSTLAATALATNKIRLTWKDNATNETGFKIERKTGASGTYAQIATVAANIVTYTNTGLTTKTTYYYRVRAYNATGNSPYSNEAHATTP
jgi:transcriptional regulator CtsR